MKYLTEFIVSLLIFGLFVGIVYIFHMTGEMRVIAQDIQKLSLQTIGVVMIPHIVLGFILPRLMNSSPNISNEDYYLFNIAANGFLILWRFDNQ
jgi:hypothetical protein